MSIRRRRIALFSFIGLLIVILLGTVYFTHQTKAVTDKTTSSDQHHAKVNTVQPASAKEVIEQHFNYLIKGDWEKAYNLLSNETKKSESLQEFIAHYQLLSQIDQLTKFEVLSQENETTFNSEEIIKQHFNNDLSVTNKLTINVIKENGVWRIVSPLNEQRRYTSMASTYTILDYMYSNGMGVEKSLEKAQSFEKKLDHFQGTDFEKLTGEADGNLILKFYKKSNAFFTQALQVAPDKTSKINTYYNLLGNFFKLNDNEDFIKTAKSLYNYDPTDPYAKKILNK